jgi:hypothetical protein
MNRFSPQYLIHRGSGRERRSRAPNGNRPVKEERRIVPASPVRPRPRRRPSSSAVIRVVGAKLPPLAFSMHPSSILANRLDPQPTKDEGRRRARGRGRFRT